MQYKKRQFQALYLTRSFSLHSNNTTAAYNLYNQYNQSQNTELVQQENKWTISLKKEYQGVGQENQAILSIPKDISIASDYRKTMFSRALQESNTKSLIGILEQTKVSYYNKMALQLLWAQKQPPDSLVGSVWNTYCKVLLPTLQHQTQPFLLDEHFLDIVEDRGLKQALVKQSLHREALEKFFDGTILGQYFVDMNEDVIMQDYLWALSIVISKSLHTKDGVFLIPFIELIDKSYSKVNISDVLEDELDLGVYPLEQQQVQASDKEIYIQGNQQSNRANFIQYGKLIPLNPFDSYNLYDVFSLYGRSFNRKYSMDQNLLYSMTGLQKEQKHEVHLPDQHPFWSKLFVASDAFANKILSDFKMQYKGNEELDNNILQELGLFQFDKECRHSIHIIAKSIVEDILESKNKSTQSIDSAKSNYKFGSACQKFKLLLQERLEYSDTSIEKDLVQVFEVVKVQQSLRHMSDKETQAIQNKTIQLVLGEQYQNRISLKQLQAILLYRMYQQRMTFLAILLFQQLADNARRYTLDHKLQFDSVHQDDHEANENEEKDKEEQSIHNMSKYKNDN